MCISGTEWIPLRTIQSSTPKQQLKPSKVRVQRLTRKKRRCEENKEEKDILELKNLKLYMENISILEQNEKLRKKAILLHQENLALMSQFQKKFPLPSKQY